MKNDDIIFWTIILLASLAALAEIGLVIYIVISNAIDLSTSLVAIVNGVAAFGLINVVKDAWKKRFIDNVGLTENYYGEINRCLRARNQCISTLQLPDHPVLHSLNKDLIRQYLIMIEEILSRKIGKHNYELALFVNSENPEIAVYHDTIGNVVPSSQAKRDTDPQYYVTKGYKVIPYLRDPASLAAPIVVSDTREDPGYHKNSKQRKRLKSTALHLIDSRWPAVLVIGCNAPNVFKRQETSADYLLGAFSGICADLNLSLRLNVQIPGRWGHREMGS